MLKLQKLQAEAKDCVARQDLETAQHLLREVIAIEKTPATCRDMAMVCLLKDNTDEAIDWLDEALEIDIHDYTALAMLSAIYERNGEIAEAMGFLALAIAEKPDEEAYLDAFAVHAGKLSFSQLNEPFANALLACLKRPDINCARLQKLWYSLLCCYPGLEGFLAKGQFDAQSMAAQALHPFFLAGLSRLLVYNRDFEKGLISLRAAVCAELQAEKKHWGREDFLKLCAALSNYCFFSEYIFDVTEEEARWADAIRQKFLASPEEATAEEIVVFSCYEALETLPNMQSLVEAHRQEPSLANVFTLQVDEILKLQEMKSGIQAVTPIEDNVSGKVREQYEEFPYPRWRHVFRSLYKEDIEETLPDGQLNILIAGCGTGYESAAIGTLFPKAKILAVDLSRNSLAYAMLRAKELGLDHITFRQGDILKLGMLPEKYDYIISSGVLHHMSDPVAGWRVLRGLLKPGGLMRIALYSEYGRKDIVAAHKIIADGQWQNTREGMKDFRRQAEEHLPEDLYKSLTARGDYFQISMYRDLLFHVQEHRFDLLEVDGILRDLSLRFAKLQVSADTLSMYKKTFKSKDALTDLKKWHTFEKTHPETFRNMYQFWCRAV